MSADSVCRQLTESDTIYCRTGFGSDKMLLFPSNSSRNQNDTNRINEKTTPM